MLVTLPFVLLLLDYWPLGRFERLALADRDGRNCVPVVPWRLLTEKLPLLAMSAASCVATLLAQSGAIIGLERLPLTWRIINALETYVIYLGQAIWPLNLAVFYPHSEMDALQPGRVAGAIGLLVAITAGTLILRRKRPYLITGWLWYLGMLIPVIGVIQVGLQARSDRYTYLPLIGIFLMVTWGVSDWATQWGRKGRQVLSSLAMIVIALLSWITWRQTTFWRTTETLWTHTLAVTAHNYVAHASFGEFLLSHGRVAEAMTHLEKALEISPHHLGAHAKLAEALLRIGNPGAAIPHWEDILQTEPRDPNAQSNLAWVYATCPQPSMRNGPKALALIQNVIKRIGRNNATVLRICAAAYAECGRFSEAMETAKEAWQLAATQGNSTLAADLEDDIVTYQRGFPLRDPNLANVQPRPEQR
jgi:tetratricopeptide (TPR) repeat protein